MIKLNNNPKDTFHFINGLMNGEKHIFTEEAINKMVPCTHTQIKMLLWNLISHCDIYPDALKNCSVEYIKTSYSNLINSPVFSNIAIPYLECKYSVFIEFYNDSILFIYLKDGEFKCGLFEKIDKFFLVSASRNPFKADEQYMHCYIAGVGEQLSGAGVEGLLTNFVYSFSNLAHKVNDLESLLHKANEDIMKLINAEQPPPVI